MLDLEKKLITWAFVAILLGGISILLYQAYEYLRLGVAPAYSVVTAMVLLGIDWAIAPSDWVGLFRILSSTPLSLVLIVIGFFGWLRTY